MSRLIAPSLAVQSVLLAALTFSGAAAASAAPAAAEAPAPRPTRYQRLLAARDRYAAIVKAGGWPELGGGPKRRLGDQDPEIATLRLRLAREGYGQAEAPAPDRFDAALRDALAAFQDHHQLPSDGVLGPQTRSALKVSAAARLAQIDVNLERWRQVPGQLPPARIVVDIAGARAVLFEAGRPSLRMRVIVGDPRHHTPLFNSRITTVVLNPPWTPPDSIVVKEIKPKAARDPGYLARNRFVVQGGRLVQLPGPANALGQVKFDMPSPTGVYLHDTPGRSAFAGLNRALSHGCVRLEKPRELAERLLAPQGWTATALSSAIETGKTQRIDLKTSLPVYLFYWTAVATDTGVDFRRDVYGLDRGVTR